jgi:hypothetical protein
MYYYWNNLYGVLEYDCTCRYSARKLVLVILFYDSRMPLKLALHALLVQCTPVLQYLVGHTNLVYQQENSDNNYTTQP